MRIDGWHTPIESGDPSAFAGAPAFAGSAKGGKVLYLYLKFPISNLRFLPAPCSIRPPLASPQVRRTLISLSLEGSPAQRPCSTRPQVASACAVPPAQACISLPASLLLLNATVGRSVLRCFTRASLHPPIRNDSGRSPAPFALPHPRKWRLIPASAPSRLPLFNATVGRSLLRCFTRASFIPTSLPPASCLFSTRPQVAPACAASPAQPFAFHKK